MMRGLKHHLYKEGLRALGLLSLEKTEGSFYQCLKHLMGGNKVDGARLFSAVAQQGAVGKT